MSNSDGLSSSAEDSEGYVSRGSQRRRPSLLAATAASAAAAAAAMHIPANKAHRRQAAGGSAERSKCRPPTRMAGIPAMVLTVLTAPLLLGSSRSRTRAA